MHMWQVIIWAVDEETNAVTMEMVTVEQLSSTYSEVKPHAVLIGGFWSHR